MRASRGGGAPPPGPNGNLHRPQPPRKPEPNRLYVIPLYLSILAILVCRLLGSQQQRYAYPTPPGFQETFEQIFQRSGLTQDPAGARQTVAALLAQKAASPTAADAWAISTASDVRIAPAGSEAASLTPQGIQATLDQIFPQGAQTLGLPPAEQTLAALLTRNAPSPSPLPQAAATDIQAGPPRNPQFALAETAAALLAPYHSTPSTLPQPEATDTPPVTARQPAPAATEAPLPSSQATFPAVEVVYFTAGDRFYQMGLDGSSPLELLRTPGLYQTLAADPAHHRLYFTRWEAAGQVLVFDTATHALGLFRDGPTDGGQGIAVDPQDGRVYLGLYYAGVYASDDAGWRQLVASEALQPMLGQRGQLQIDPANRQVYFRTAFNGECGPCRYIWRAAFDGSDLAMLLPANGGDALALDPAASKLYFSDLPGDYTIQRANLDGSNPETLLTLPEPYRFCKGMAVDARHGKLYLSLYTPAEDNYRGRAIARANLDGSEYEILFEMRAETGDEVSGGMAVYLP